MGKALIKNKNKLNKKKIRFEIHTGPTWKIYVSNFRALNRFVSALRERQTNRQILSSFINTDMMYMCIKTPKTVIVT